jgi:hypothetical protein
MTNIELETLQAVKTACREYCKTQSWKNIRIQAAIAIAQGRMASRSIITDEKVFARSCVEYADALVDELKKWEED